jgi:hypothetical protein
VALSKLTYAPVACARTGFHSPPELPAARAEQRPGREDLVVAMGVGRGIGGDVVDRAAHRAHLDQRPLITWGGLHLPDALDA